MTQRWGIRFVLALVFAALAAGIALAAAPPAHADTNDFSFDSMHVDYDLTRDTGRHADLTVTETLVARFPDTDQNHGIERAIPTTADGRSLHVEVKSVTDASGKPLTWQKESEGEAGFTVLRIGDEYAFVHGEQTYVITYTMRDVIHQASGGVQQFLFDVNGTGWSQSFGEVTATLHVPAGLAGSLNGDAACYQGAEGSTQKCTISRTDDGYDVTASDLGPHESVTMSVGFKPGTFAVPISVARLLVWLLLGLAVVLLAVALVVRIRFLGNPKGTGIIVPQYQPFPGIGVMEAAELLDERDRAFPALITQLVVSRAATMTRDDKGTEKTSDDIYSLTLVDPTVLDEQDADAARTLFGSAAPGASVRLDPKDRTIGDRIRSLLLRAGRSTRAQGLIRRKLTPLVFVMLGAAAVVFLLAVISIFIGGMVGYYAWVHWVALAVVALLALGAGALTLPLERRTEQATPAYEHLLGIRDYLRLAEADRIKMLQSPTGAETVPAPSGEQLVKLYEKLLPYAILFNIEKEWREVLGHYWETTPTEVTPELRPMHGLVFASAFASHNFATTVSTSSGSHSWSSSGGGGFSSGSSGGGFGGGGGGGW
ncbi:DUF2207 domain-containing protein [Gryllotalpicola ginsengisoli]|uniref:DUF2207 domain-containing protein n=1 Tax=Gryllotalpicola ginsengisoli TaxID=444608 RepID=UPI0003B48279|nr:DUF2207 domain-containing protein [Gryllotalpicola ginsengisoli]